MAGWTATGGHAVVPQRAAGLAEEDVVEAGAVERQRLGREALAVEQAEDGGQARLAVGRRRGGRGRRRARLAHERLRLEQPRGRARAEPSTPIVTTSPAIARLSSAAVPSATIRPWSMIARRSHRASASSR